MTTHLQRLERSLANVTSMPNGKDSLYAQDLRAQIAAAKWTLAQKTLSPSELEETYFGGTRGKSSATNQEADEQLSLMAKTDQALARLHDSHDGHAMVTRHEQRPTKT